MGTESPAATTIARCLCNRVMLGALVARRAPACATPYYSQMIRLRKRTLEFAGAVLFVADLFHPVDNFPGELFLNGNVRHGCGRRRPMPVLLAGREPDHLTGPDLLDRSAFALRPAAASRDDEGL